MESLFHQGSATVQVGEGERQIDIRFRQPQPVVVVSHERDISKKEIRRSVTHTHRTQQVDRDGTTSSQPVAGF